MRKIIVTIFALAIAFAPIVEARTTRLYNIPTNGLVAYYSLNEGTGTGIKAIGDYSGNNNFGTTSGMTSANWVRGYNGAGITCGASQYITFGRANTGATTYTLSIWFYRTGTGSTASTGSGGVTAEPLIAKLVGESDGSNLDGNYFMGLQQSPLRLVGDFERTGNGLNAPIIGSTTLSNNVWNHVAYVFDGSNSRLYVNGQADGNPIATTSVPRSDSIQHLGICAGLNSSGTSSGSFVGQVDEARIYNRALSATEISALYQQRSAFVESGRTFIIR